MKRKLMMMFICSALILSACSGKGGSTSISKDGGTNKESGTASVSGNTGKEEEKQIFPAFTATDANGNEVTEKIFADKDITMVNLWGTFCPPCIREMPELQQIYEKLPENAGMIGIAVDVPAGHEGQTKAMNLILEKTGVKYTNLLLDEGLTEFVSAYSAVPTTVFVNKDGEIVAEITGALIDEYVETFKEYLEGWEY